MYAEDFLCNLETSTIGIVRSESIVFSYSFTSYVENSMRVKYSSVDFKHEAREFA